ncbi:MAG: hypothetical protein JNL11_03990 [Bdellovibrionaceae bacterium]|nr:hypothetical protein [Pseudobdellovibrionaceae bacterium]
MRLALTILLLSLQGLAELSFSSNARTFETQHSSIVVKGLAHSCLTIMTIPDGLPCNPAYTPLNKKPSLGIEILLSNGYSSLENLRSLLSNKINQELADTLFSKGKILQIESNIDINFRSKYLNGQYSPMTVKGFSVVRNEANPDVDLYAVEEKGFSFQSGYEITDNFYTGAQVRLVNRKFIRRQFKLVSLGTQAGADYLKPKEQTATYFEPAASWIIAEAWKPRISLLVANLGTISENHDELKTPVEPQVGFGFSPPVMWGDLDISLEYRSMTYEESNFDKLHIGSLYRFGSMYLTGGIDANGISSGVYYSLDKINAGIMYSTTRFVNDNEDFFTQTVYMQLGWQI